MKRKRCRFFIFLSILSLLVGYVILPYITPGTTIINKTDQVIYVNVTQYAKEATPDELTDAELAQLKIFIPIQAQKTHYFPVSFSALVDTRLIAFAPIWDIGSRANTSNVGGHSFDLKKSKGSCQIDIKIYADSYEIIPKETLYCYKKLLPRGGNMIIHADDKTIFNAYSQNADKIEKQTIRWK